MTLRVAVPDMISPSYFPAIAAVELGFFKREGLDATLELIYPVAKAYGELRDGQLDFVGAAAHGIPYGFEDWKGAKILCALSQYMYWFLVVRSDLDAKRGDLSAVRGLRIGAATGPIDGLKRLLADAGIDPERDLKIGPVSGWTPAGANFGLMAAKALEEGEVDGFWANGMGAELAVRKGIGSLLLDARREAPPAARRYTFPALVATEKKLADHPEVVRAAVRAVVGAQKALKTDPARAAEVGKRLYPPREADLIAELVRRDAPFYDAAVSRDAASGIAHFARDIGIASTVVSYEDAVATQLAQLWH